MVFLFICTNTFHLLSRIFLPVNVIISKDGNVTVIYQDTAQCYEVYLRKYSFENAEQSSSLQLSNLDILSKYLSWRNNDIQEGKYLINWYGNVIH